MLVKNTFGVSTVSANRYAINIEERPFAGSSLDRKKLTPHEKEKRKMDSKAIKELQKNLVVNGEGEDNLGQAKTLNDIIKLKKMSSRTKSKIRVKIMAFAQKFKRLTFVTLTFVNAVEDKKAVAVLKKFLDNTKKNKENFEYLWVAERQTNNETFKDNIHFHLVTNKYWDIEKTWNYWLNVQKKSGIVPRESHFRPASAFNVKQIESSNLRKLTNYLTKYITKNKSEFNCQVWNCSNGVSELYTAFYTKMDFVNELHRLKPNEIKIVPKDYCNVHIIPLDKTTLRFYDRLKNKNNVEKLSA